MSACKKLLAEVSNYLDNELDAGLRAEIEGHMRRCPDCYVIIDSTRKTVQVYRGCQPYDVSQALHNRIEEALRAHVTKSSNES